MTCQHLVTTSTFAKCPHCATCQEPLVSMFWPISRNTPEGAVLYALRKLPAPAIKPTLPDWMKDDADDVQALMDRDMGDN